MNEQLLRLTAFANTESEDSTKKYLERYWLNMNELTFWEDKKLTIFSENFKSLPDKLFKDDFKSIVMKGGLIFVEEDYNILRECMKTCGDKNFVIIEDYNESSPPHKSGPSLRFRYPVSALWNELKIHDGICYELFERPVRNYFVFGDSGLWGKYVANDYHYPVDILGYSSGIAEIIGNRFLVSSGDMQDLQRGVPELLKKKPN